MMGDIKPKRYYLFFFLCAYVLVYISGEKFLIRCIVMMLWSMGFPLRSDIFSMKSEGRRTLASATAGPLFASLIRIDHPAFLLAAVAITILIVTTVVKILLPVDFKSNLLLSNWFKISWQENVFQLLMKLTEGSAYTKMINQIEGELMNVGFTGRFLKLKLSP